jgi:hypothetical protein
LGFSVWVFGYVTWFIWIFGFGYGSGIESKPINQTQRPKKSSTKPNSNAKTQRNQKYLSFKKIKKKHIL